MVGKVLQGNYAAPDGGEAVVMEERERKGERGKSKGEVRESRMKFLGGPYHRSSNRMEN